MDAAQTTIFVLSSPSHTTTRWHSGTASTSYSTSRLPASQPTSHLPAKSLSPTGCFPMRTVVDECSRIGLVVQVSTSRSLRSNVFSRYLADWHRNGPAGRGKSEFRYTARQRETSAVMALNHLETYSVGMCKACDSYERIGLTDRHRTMSPASQPARMCMTISVGKIDLHCIFNKLDASSVLIDGELVWQGNTTRTRGIYIRRVVFGVQLATRWMSRSNNGWVGL